MPTGKRDTPTSVIYISDETIVSYSTSEISEIKNSSIFIRIDIHCHSHSYSGYHISVSYCTILTNNSNLLKLLILIRKQFLNLTQKNKIVLLNIHIDSHESSVRI